MEIEGKRKYGEEKVEGKMIKENGKREEEERDIDEEMVMLW